MLKRQELTDPNSCLNRAEDDEPIFVLLGRDVAAPSTIREWVQFREAHRKNQAGDMQLMEALELAKKMEQYREDLDT